MEMFEEKLERQVSLNKVGIYDFMGININNKIINI